MFHLMIKLYFYRFRKNIRIKMEKKKEFDAEKHGLDPKFRLTKFADLRG